MRYFRNIGTCALAAIILLTSTASIAARGSDDEVRSRIMHQLFDAGLVRIQVSVSGGDVTLTGTVPSVWAKNEAIKKTRKVSGVMQVTSTLEIVKGEGDAILAREVARELRGSTFVSVFDLVNATIANGVITLTGEVTAPITSERLVDAVSRLEGAQDVVDHIEVLPASTSDDQIRVAVANRIYNAPSFLRYNLNVHPPIRVIVRYGHVRLAGAVATEADKTLAGALAGGVFGVRGVQNDLQVTG